MKTIRIGTRGSRLALAQAEDVRSRLAALFPDTAFETVTIKTTGDKILDAPLSKIGDKGLFTKELEQELLAGTIDCAVHSMKDMPTKLPDGLGIVAVTERLDPRDVLVSKNGKKLSDFNAGDTIATSSLRRRAQIMALVPGIRVVDMRGNIITRMEKLQANAEIDGMILAHAGIARLGMDRVITEIIATEQVLPPVGQAALAIESRAGDRETNKYFTALNHEQTEKEISCERAFLARLEGGCQVPIAALCRMQGPSLHLSGLVASLDGNIIFRDRISGGPDEAEALGTKLAETLLEAGAQKILDEIYRC
ncbi:MAG TPA: hydroxymethylbilane synthase [Spirochaetota bacterium]|nr:hydroxymethylbilane synthase [Spirochaetota bacterium]HPI89477.1 hydroxymethylbilane synthase [Spirochaetota bacterium]HPR49334.1 hydroxymethylbilane synthase [Spirochaetota bacterium]